MKLPIPSRSRKVREKPSNVNEAPTLYVINPRLLKVFLFLLSFCLALDLFISKTVLSPVEVAVHIEAHDASVSGNYREILTADARMLGVQNIPKIARRGFISDKNGTLAFIDTRWELHTPSGDKIVALEDGGKSPIEVIWPEDIHLTVKYLQTRTISSLFLFFLQHVGGLAYSPYWLVANGKKYAKAKMNDYGVANVLFGASTLMLFQMVTAFFWCFSFSQLPMRTVPVLFHSTLALVYGLSIVVFPEQMTRLKTITSVVVTIGAIILACPEAAGQNSTTVGVIFAVGGATSKAVSLVWFKWNFGEFEWPFVFTFFSIVGLFYVFAVLPVIFLSDLVGVETFVFEVPSFSTMAFVLGFFLNSCWIHLGTLVLLSCWSPVAVAGAHALVVPIEKGFELAFARTSFPSLLSSIVYVTVLVSATVFIFCSKPPASQKPLMPVFPVLRIGDI